MPALRNAYLRGLCVALVSIFLGNINFAHGKQTLRLLLTKTDAEGEATWTQYLKQLEQEADLTFEAFSTEAKYSSQEFLQLCEKTYDLCLVMKSSDPGPLSEDLLLLSPAYVFATPGGVRRDFTKVFHSSVWAFLLLAVLLSIGLLSGFEFLHPFGFRMQRRWNYEDAAKLTLSECVLHIFGGLFLKAPSKRPRSLAGNILVVFWSAFSLCMVALFVAGTAVSVFAAPQGLWLSALPSGPLPPPTCASSDLFCGLAAKMACPGGPQRPACGLLQQLRPSNGGVMARVAAGEAGLVTDSVAASQLLRGGANLSAVLLGPPLASLALRARDAALLPAISRGVLVLRQRGAGVPGGGGGSSSEQMAAALPIRLPSASAVFVLLLFGAAVAVAAQAAEFVVRTFVTKDYKRLQEGLGDSSPPNETTV